MEKIIQILNLVEVQKLRIGENIECSLCNLNSDKVIILAVIDSLDTLRTINHAIPQIREQLTKQIKSGNNTELVNEAILPVPKFLWDLYIVGLHQIDNESSAFDPVKVSDIQRNRFLARKIVLEFSNKSELVELFNKAIRPYSQLDKSFEEAQGEKSNMMAELLQDVDETLIRRAIEKEDKPLTIVDLSSFIKKVKEYIK